ncbi:MAG TPA: hypothetical protein VIU02_01400 [Burkholderiales bacterium]
MTRTLITIGLTILVVALWILAVQPHRAAAASQPTVNAPPASAFPETTLPFSSPRRQPDHVSGIRGSADARLKLKHASFVAFRE